jgi:uroporphyrinogen-III synthase
VSQWRLLLTRPAEDCAALAQPGRGGHGQQLPAVAGDRAFETSAQLAAGWAGQAIIVVSKPAARLLLEQLAKAGIAPPPGWFTVGEATARCCRARA